MRRDPLVVTLPVDDYYAARAVDDLAQRLEAEFAQLPPYVVRRCLDGLQSRARRRADDGAHLAWLETQARADLTELADRIGQRDDRRHGGGQ